MQVEFAHLGVASRIPSLSHDYWYRVIESARPPPSLLARVGLTPHESPASIRVLGTERRHDPGGRVLVK